MHQKIRQQHHLNVPRDVVYATRLNSIKTGWKVELWGQRRKKKGHFTTKGVDWVHSLDRHCKLMGHQRFTFPLAVYGCMDSASRKLFWLRVWTDSCDPKLVARWYFDYLYERRIIASIIRIDKGTETGDITETGDMETLHACLRRNHGDINPEDTVVYGKSTSNQV